MLFVLLHLLLDRKRTGKIARFPRFSLLALYSLLLPLFAQNAAAEKSYPLTQAANGKSLQRVRAVIEVQGELKLNSDGKAVRKVPLKVKADLVYDEQRLSPQQGIKRSARFYHQAKATIEVNGNPFSPVLNHKLIQVHATDSRPILFSPLSPLTRQELELIDISGNTLVLTDLLPARSVKLEETWEASHATLAGLLGLDTIANSDVVCKLAEVNDNKALIHLRGKLDGAADGVVSEIELKANLEFDLNKKRVNWLTMVVSENRDIGHAQPGFQVTARLRLVSAPISSSPGLTEQRLAQCLEAPEKSATVLSLDSTHGGFKMLHDRGWKVMVDRPDVTIMRFIERGNLVTQCNIRNLPELAEGEQLTLEGFREDIRKSMENTFSQFIEASEKAENGLRILRVVVAGAVSELPIQWTYYHLSDDQGRRTSLAFTTESKLVEQFAAGDELLISSFGFTNLPQPTPAPTDQPAKQVEETASKPEPQTTR